MADLTQGPSPLPRNHLADWLRERGMRGLSDRVNDPTSGAGMVADGVGGLVNALIVDPARSFKHLWDNGYQQGNPASAEHAMNVAGGAMLGGIAAPRPANAVGMFGGRLSAARLAEIGENRPLRMLHELERMQKAGASREDIWSATAKIGEGSPYNGAHIGVDNKPRFEISDSLVMFSDKTQKGQMSDVLHHPDLYRAYPDVGRIKTETFYGPKRGFYESDGKLGHERIVIRAPDGDISASIALHEAQHAIQAREGFAPGSSASAEQSARPGMRYPWGGVDAYEAYRRSAGEVEARAVQARQNLSANQRRARPPWLDYDVPEGKQIVRESTAQNPLAQTYSNYGYQVPAWSMNNLPPDVI